MTTAGFTFAVRRREPMLVGPSAPTPRETKRLFDLDDHETLRRHVPFLFFYRGGEAHAHADGRNPAGEIRRALGEALMPYYPLAGRLREVEARKLVVDCTGDGVMFVEADADVRMAELEAAAAGLTPPFPCIDQLLLDVEGSSGVLGCPMLPAALRRLRLGGPPQPHHLRRHRPRPVHVRRSELPAPIVAPSWSRELLEARDPPRPTFPHREFDVVPPPLPPPPGDMVMRTFTFDPSDMSAIRKDLPPNLWDTATTFELLTAALWRARTAALELSPDEDVRLVFIFNIRGLSELGLPAGYYGNACVSVAVVVTTETLLAGSLGDAVELLREAKATVTAEYVRSTADLLVLRGRPYVAMSNLFLVSDNRHVGFRRVDFGWGEPVYGGPASVLFGGSFFVHVGNGGEVGAAAAMIMLPRPAMDRFASEVKTVLKG